MAPPMINPLDSYILFFTRLVAWVAFMTCFAMLVGLVIFLGLGLYRGIIWLWPGGPLG